MAIEGRERVSEGSESEDMVEGGRVKCTIESMDGSRLIVECSQGSISIVSQLQARVYCSIWYVLRIRVTVVRSIDIDADSDSDNGMGG